MAVERISLHGVRTSARPVPPTPAAPQGQVDTVLVGTLIVLASLGMLVLFSASYAVGIRDTGDGLYFLKRQLSSALLGIVALLITSRVDYHFWRRLSVPAMIGTALLLLAVLPLGRTVFGARRWFDLGPVQVQPSEIMKFVLILYMADLLDRKGSRIRHFLNGAIPFAIILGAILFLVMLEPDLGTATVLAVIGLSVFLVAGADIRQLGLFLMSGVGAFALLAFTAPYRRERLLLFLHPERDLRDAGWQLWQARIALGDGGIFGLGLGASRQKFSWLPAAHTDAIFAVIGEELGLVGCAIVIGLFAAMAVRGYRTAMHAPDRFGAIMATGITTWLVFQAVINIGGVTTAIPFTGVPLPLFSYGGSSLAVTLGALGVLISISRTTRVPARVRRRAPQTDGNSDE
ncbi:MAG: putative lipid II flippase FtsW [Chloroflexota bacterium]|nr:putative lipid II flippase FtsW [Chloroflexota bacterium]